MVASEEFIKSLKKSNFGIFGIPGEKISSVYGSKDISKVLADLFKKELESKNKYFYCPDCGTRITDFDDTYSYLVCNNCGAEFKPVDLVNFNKEM